MVATQPLARAVHSWHCAGMANHKQPGASDATTDPARWGIPDSEICSAEMQFASDASPAFLHNHCVRSHLFGRELASAQGLRSGADYDEELLFLACVLHDLGITAHAAGNQRFEVDGLDKELLPAGFADRVHAAWPRFDLGYALADAIASDVRSNPLKGPPFSFPAHVYEIADNEPPMKFTDVVANSGWDDRPLATRSR